MVAMFVKRSNDFVHFNILWSVSKTDSILYTFGKIL